ncbi:Hypothetical protein FKW44_019124 [Caligus rogercresseyi]|uniref:Uncharacterized protein n=1 Tax=Caligus rogercresseyi TaxID=217165 RepID=A0A7T8GVD8_CALRO|nr:Hypothetical protein FKW44_019124 [Caligus rogercresseyi]
MIWQHRCQKGVQYVCGTDNIRAAARVERKREREEVQKRQYKAWLKQETPSWGTGRPKEHSGPKTSKKKYQEP